MTWTRGSRDNYILLSWCPRNVENKHAILHAMPCGMRGRNIIQKSIHTFAHTFVSKIDNTNSLAMSLNGTLLRQNRLPTLPTATSSWTNWLFTAISSRSDQGSWLLSWQPFHLSFHLSTRWQCQPWCQLTEADSAEICHLSVGSR